MIDTLVGLSLRKKIALLRGEYRDFRETGTFQVSIMILANSRDRRGKSYTFEFQRVYSAPQKSRVCRIAFGETCATDFWHVSIIDSPLEISARDTRAHYLYLSLREREVFSRYFRAKYFVAKYYVRRKT